MAANKCEIECAEYSCRIIGYTVLKEEVIRVHEWKRCFCCVTNQVWQKHVFCMPACLAKAYDKLRDTTGSIAVIVTPLDLVAITESMVKQSCPQAIQTQAMLISESHPFLVIKILALQSIPHNLDPSSSKRRVWPRQTTPE